MSHCFAGRLRYCVFIMILLICPTLNASESHFEPFPITYEHLIEAALVQTQKHVSYDPTYFKIPYPNGDVPSDKGVCTDVIIRAYRSIGIDLQKLVHEDMKKYFSLYPPLWGLKKTDTNIDHRRVPNLQVFFKRHGKPLAITNASKDYQPGHIVTWDIGGQYKSIPHIGLVVNRKSADGLRYLVVHNIGAGPQCEDVLFEYPITGHYFYLPT